MLSNGTLFLRLLVVLAITAEFINASPISKSEDGKFSDRRSTLNIFR